MALYSYWTNVYNQPCTPKLLGVLHQPYVQLNVNHLLHIYGNFSLPAAIRWEAKSSSGVNVTCAGGQTSKCSKPNLKAHVNVLVLITAHSCKQIKTPFLHTTS